MLIGHLFLREAVVSGKTVSKKDGVRGHFVTKEEVEKEVACKGYRKIKDSLSCRCRSSRGCCLFIRNRSRKSIYIKTG